MVDIEYFALIALILTLLVLRTRRNEGGLRSFFSKPIQKSFAKKRDLAILVVFKNCPQCDEQMPVSTLVCDSCDYNFLSSSILRHKMLPAPQSSNAGVAPQQAFAYRT
jgi:hypothetical protein